MLSWLCSLLAARGKGGWALAGGGAPVPGEHPQAGWEAQQGCIRGWPVTWQTVTSWDTHVLRERSFVSRLPLHTKDVPAGWF